LAQSQDELKKSVAETAKCSAELARCSAGLTNCGVEFAAQKELAERYEKQLNDSPQAKMEKEQNEEFDSILTMAIEDNKSLTQENERLKEQIDKLTKELEEAKK